MVDREVLARKLLALNESLGASQRPQAADATALAADPVLRAAVERWLQVAIEACIDIAAHAHIPLDLAQRLGRAAAMRDVLVHDYVDIDLELLARAVREDAADLRAFGAAAAQWLAPR